MQPSSRVSKSAFFFFIRRQQFKGTLRQLNVRLDVLSQRGLQPAIFTYSKQNPIVLRAIETKGNAENIEH